MRFAAIFSLLLLWPLAAGAQCVGQNLIAALPADQLAALQTEAEVPFATGNLWTATKGAQTVTLIGTFHLDDPRHADTIRAVTADLNGATALMVEAGPQEEAALKSHLAANPQRLVNTAGPPLPEVLTKTDWQRLTVALQTRGIPAIFAARLQPWYVTTLLAIPACQMDAAANSNGQDHRLIDAATARGLPILGLERYDTVFTLFDSITVPDQLSMLVQTLDAAPVEDDMAITLADAYFAGQSRLFWAFSKTQTGALSGLTKAETDRSFALIEEAMITRRNRAWIPVITDAAAKGPLVVAVGALHLPGQEGVLNLLVQQGWTVASLAP